MGAPPLRTRKNRSLFVLVGAVIAMVAAAFVFRPQPDHAATPSRTARPHEGVLAELSGLPITIYGDSLAATGDYYTPGHHWTELLKAGSDVGPITDHGIGGTTMEQTTNVVGGSTPMAWKTPSEPTLVIVMSVLNAVTRPESAALNEKRSTTSLKAAATSVGAILLSDAVEETRTDVNQYTGAWSPYPGVALAGGSIAHAKEGTVTFTVPAGYSHRQLWMATLAGAESTTYRVEHNGTPVDTDPTPYSEISNPVFSKYLLPIGKVDSGDTVTVTNTSGDFWYDGMYIDNGTTHVAYATEMTHVPGTIFGNTELNESHDQAIRDAVAELNDLVPDGASLLDLALDRGFDQATMTIADRIHPNDRGQQWLFENLLADLEESLPVTSRLGA